MSASCCLQGLVLSGRCKAMLAGLARTSQSLAPICKPQALPCRTQLEPLPPRAATRGQLLTSLPAMQLGKGQAAFQQARDAMQRWQHMDLGWVVTNRPPIREGSSVCVAARLFGLWMTNPLRISYVHDQGTRTRRRLLSRSPRGELECALHGGSECSCSFGAWGRGSPSGGWMPGCAASRQLPKQG